MPDSAIDITGVIINTYNLINSVEYEVDYTLSSETLFQVEPDEFSSSSVLTDTLITYTAGTFTFELITTNEV